MATRKVKIAVSDLELGMFVSDLDRPWFETPFPIQGFYIRSVADIKALETYCKFVFVDVPVEVGDVSVRHAEIPDDDSVRVVQFRRAARSGQDKAERVKVPPIKIRDAHHYPVVRPLKKSIGHAERLLRQVDESVCRLYERLAEGKADAMAETAMAAKQMTRSVIENPDALVWMARVKQKSDHVYAHAVASSIWGLVFARHLGLAPDVMQTLAQGLLLSQVGKTRLDDRLLTKPGFLDATEYRAWQRYVEEGVAILSQTPGISGPVVKVVEYHRERHNGSGFPKGVTGDRIPMLGKIAGIVEHFQALIEPRPGVTPLSPSQAIARLYEQRNIEFQEDLVERFIQAIGVYPAGTLVELSDGSVGVVVGQNAERKLFPQVLRVLDAEKQPLRKQELVDLRKLNDAGQVVLKIARTLPQDAYDIDLEDCRIPTGWGLRRWVG